MWWLLAGLLVLDTLDKVDALEKQAKQAAWDKLSPEEKKKRNEAYARASAVTSPWQDGGGFIV